MDAHIDDVFDRDALLADINQMTHVEMARMWRFAPVGHVYFIDEQLFAAFKARFDVFGGITPEVSKHIGFGG